MPETAGKSSHVLSLCAFFIQIRDEISIQKLIAHISQRDGKLSILILEINYS
jgi:hypothetical protein